MKTCVVILNYNGRKHLERFLPSVTASIEGEDACLVIADNASTDDSIAFLKKNYPGIKLIRLRKNWGFAEGYNRALGSLEAEYFVLLNSDVETPAGWLHPLVEWMDLHEDCAACGPKLRRIDERDSFEYSGAAGGYIDRLGYPFCRGRVMKDLEMDEGQYDIPADVFWASGACLMVRSEVYFGLGGLCKEFFAHMEEIDFCWRAKLSGWKTCIVPRSTVYHLGGGTLEAGNARKVFLNHRNNLLMLRRSLPYTCAVSTIFSLIAKQIDIDAEPDRIDACMDEYFAMPAELREEMAAMCAKYGIMHTRSVLIRRFFLDRIAALFYKRDSRRAVREAWKEFRHMGAMPREEEIKEYLFSILEDSDKAVPEVLLTENEDLDNWGDDSFGVRGMWGKWMILQHFLKKEGIFAQIKDRMV